MNGLRVELEIGGEREKFYFATRRRGDEGEQMRAAQREFRAARMDAIRIGSKLVALGNRMDADGASDALDAEAAVLLRESREACERAQNCAEQLVRLSLAENYGADDIEQLMMNLTDAQIAQLVGIIETGAVPEDFFPSCATPPSASTSSQPGAGPGASSSNTDSPAQTSIAAT